VSPGNSGNNPHGGAPGKTGNNPGQNGSPPPGISEDPAKLCDAACLEHLEEIGKEILIHGGTDVAVHTAIEQALITFLLSIGAHVGEAAVSNFANVVTALLLSSSTAQCEGANTESFHLPGKGDVCICKQGYIFDHRIGNILVCSKCGPDKIEDANGVCTSCPSGSTMNPNTQQCTCNDPSQGLNDKNQCVPKCGDVVCPSGQTCNAGACGFCPSGTTMNPSTGECQCSPGLNLCGNICSNLQAESTNCGACGHACTSGQTCTNGQCTCDTGQSVCNGSCVNTLADVNNCGACGTVCQGGLSCIKGSCQCQEGGTFCPNDNSCTNTQSDRNNCGSCGNACPFSGQQCVSGSCQCAQGLEVCGNQCVDTSNNRANCGACGHACPSDASCTSGACICPQGTQECNGKCVDPTTAFQSDSGSCGTCGHACVTGQSCQSGSCTDMICPSGQTLCKDPNAGSHYGTCQPNEATGNFFSNSQNKFVEVTCPTASCNSVLPFCRNAIEDPTATEPPHCSFNKDGTPSGLC